jgi:hypothetical protein
MLTQRPDHYHHHHYGYPILVHSSNGKRLRAAAEKQSTRTSRWCCAEKTEYCNVPEPARRLLVHRKQTNNGIGSDAAPAWSTLQSPAPQPTYAAGCCCYRRQWGQKQGRSTSTSGEVNNTEWERGRGSEPEEGHPQSTKLTHPHLPLLTC